MLPSILTTVNQDNYLAIWLCLVRQTCYSCLVSNGEQRWGGEGEITLPLICAKSTVNLQEKEKKMFVINTEASLHFTSRGGVYITGEGEAGGGVSACPGPSMVPLCFCV